MRRRFAILLLGAAACGQSADGPDAAPSGVCVSRPGLRVHLVFAAGPAPRWSDPDPLILMTTGGGTSRYQVTPDQLSAERRVVVVLDYPRGTVDGDASVAFYGSSGGVAAWQSEPLRFTATTAGIACTELDLVVYSVGAFSPP